MRSTAIGRIVRLSELPADNEVACPPTATKTPGDCSPRFLSLASTWPRKTWPCRPDESNSAAYRDALTGFPHKPAASAVASHTQSADSGGATTASGKMYGASSAVLVAVILVVAVIAL